MTKKGDKVREILREIARTKKAVWWSWDELTEEVNLGQGPRGISKMTVISLCREFPYEFRFSKRHLREIRFL